MSQHEKLMIFLKELFPNGCDKANPYCQYVYLKGNEFYTAKLTSGCISDVYILAPIPPKDYDNPESIFDDIKHYF